MKVGAGVFLGVIVLAGLLVIFGPFLTIWALNTLFKTGIEYNLSTWGASFILSCLVANRSSTK